VTATDTIYGVGEAPDEIDFSAEASRLRQARRERERLGFGAWPAVVVVDMQAAFTEPSGERMSPVLAATGRLLEAARARQVPVFYTVMHVPSLDAVNLRWRTTHDLRPFLPGRPSARIDDRIAPQAGDVLVAKPHASAFFGTDLHARLAAAGADTVLVTGTSTSGCVRATAIDAAAHDFHSVVVEDCVYDPRPFSREAALWDLADRYADVVDLAAVLEHVSTVVAA
jgi:maleamate amidohydrolase